MDKDDLIKKWLNDELTGAEKKQFCELSDSEFNEVIVDKAKHFKASNFFKTSEFESFKELYEQQKPTKKYASFNVFLKIASVVIIGLGLYYTIFFNAQTNIETLAGEKLAYILPDNSIVELNALSSIKYTKEEWQDHRMLLLDGEAFFKVEKGSTFNVKTSHGLVTVVGTEFNVKQRRNYFEVKCFEGIVKVNFDHVNKTLSEGNSFLVLNGEFTEGEINNKAPKWTENMSEFNAIPFKEVLAEIERQYNLQIVYKDINTNRLFTGGFPHDNLENALIAITQPMNLSYELSPSNMVTIHDKEN
ncbi:FecR family protein [Seonamhaeicola maritimus]|uniref:FecR family protein n=1 Tax=Seonamhaeicola maritimus TaxID=2591822 RepID=UPI0024940822|nr:FecR family protein [Seonamhaeicola maritimus]